MSDVSWIIQDKFVKPTMLTKLVRAIEENEDTVTIIDYPPFSTHIPENIPTDVPTIFYGSVNFTIKGQEAAAFRRAEEWPCFFLLLCEKIAMTA